MRLENITAAFFVMVILFTLVNLEPYHTGHFLMPSPISLELGILIIFISLVIVLFIMVPKKKYHAY